MNVELQFDRKALDDTIDEIIDFVELDAIYIAQNITVFQVKELTAQGVAPDGSQYEAYTPRYARYKAKKGLATKPVNIRLSGDTMGTLGIYGSRVTVDAAHKPIIEGLQKKRTIFEVSNATIKHIEADITEAVNNIQSR